MLLPVLLVVVLVLVVLVPVVVVAVAVVVAGAGGVREPRGRMNGRTMMDDFNLK